MAKLVPDVTAQDHQLGPADAPATLVEFGDYQCPYCRQAHGVVKSLLAQFGDQLRYVFRDFPLDRPHPQASSAANFADFADTYGKYWEAHDELFEHQDQLGTDYYQQLAQELELPVQEALDAVAEGRFNDRIQKAMDSGAQSNVPGTPSFFLNGQTFEGRFTKEVMGAAIQAIIAKS